MVTTKKSEAVKKPAGPRVIVLKALSMRQAVGLAPGKPSFEDVALRLCAQGYQPVSVNIHEGTLFGTFWHPGLWEQLNGSEAAPDAKGNGHDVDPEEFGGEDAPHAPAVERRDLGEPEIVER